MSKTSANSSHRRFLSMSMIYAVGDLLTKCARFVLIPYYVHELTRSELGTLGVVQAITLACWYLFAGGSGFGVQRFFFDYKDRGTDFVASLWWSRLVVAALPCALLIAIGYNGTPLVAPEIPAALVAIAVMTGFLRGGNNILESWFIIREKPVAYRTFTFLQFLTTTTLIVYLVTWRGYGIMGAVVGEFISYLIWSVVSAAILVRAGKIDFGLVKWREFLRYCSPILPHTLFMWGLASSDRLILKSHGVKLETIGTYEFGYLLASSLSVFALAMRSAWLPSFLRNADSETGRSEYAETACIYFAVVLFAATGMIVLAPEMVQILAFGKAEYQDSVVIVRIVSLGLVFQSLFIAFNQPLIYAKKTGQLATISGMGFAANIILNLLLVPRFGILGAAISTVVAYVLLATLMFYSTQHFFHIEWKYKRFAVTALGAGLTALVGCSLGIEHLMASVGAKLFVGALFMIFLVFLVVVPSRSSKDVTMGVGPS